MAAVHEDLLRAGVAYVDQWVAYQQERRQVPGLVVAVAHDEQILLSRGYGYANLERGEAMTPQHIFRVASHSKTFTATAIMQLKEQGRLRLDDRMAEYIPWLQAQEDLREVTIRQALNHAAGIRRDGTAADYWQLDGAFPDGAALRRLVEDGGAVLAANESFKYSNLGYALLGLVVEAASGTPYHDYVTQHIVAPLALTDTGPETDARVQARLATGYSAQRGGLPRRPIPDVSTHALAAATGFYATAEDLCRYAAAHCFGNTSLLSDASKREMQQPYWVIERADEHYGLGFSMRQIGERRIVGHGGAFPGHATRTLFDPRDRLAVVVLTNAIDGPAADLGRTIMALLDFALSQPPLAAHRAPDALAGYAGRFFNLWGVTDVVAFGETLVAIGPDDAEPVKNATRLAVEDEATLRITATNGYADPGEAVRYTRDASGRVTSIVAGGMSSYPLEIYRERVG